MGKPKKRTKMNIQSFNEHLDYNDNRIVTQVLLETPFSKEIRILLKDGQTMNEHKAPLPIIVHLLEGEIDFGVEGEIISLKKGDIITLESNISHDLTAKKDSIVRLTLSKLDDANRVKKVAQKS
jgi:quercetin dioxygenase-like cupin family protein